ncbi:efflux RND transporter periplasmic adaptor subunit [Xanthobacter autotrophicus]|uniref:efflux RND transporter periplasmic adaptor subunit n=1 Tax=Xanthobacter autotrophicus TaxID=280 RepID=UPI001E2B443D|nr:efflux RND transporter periplasmic adaptor subunit [Xanthobacter autotrophicus]UDQ90524.1 efflux RND transporter periplasmic adaptor subunit [Xanthobacter autotrophicus]
MRVFPLVISSIVVAAGALAWQQGLIGAAAQAPKPKAPPPPIPVIATAVKTEDVPVYGEGIGTVQASNTITVKVRVDGELTKVVFKEGQEVKAGDILAQIDQRPFAAALAQAKAARAKDEALLANAKADYDRYKVLVPKQAASQQQLDTQSALVAQYQAQIAGDEAAIDTAQIQLDYATIRAPISGRTGVRLVDEGNIVHANDEGGLVVITQLKPVAVVFTLPQDRLDDMQAALARGPVSALAFRRDGVTKVGEGMVALIDNQISSDTGTLRIKAVFPNDDLKLWPGAFVNVKVLLDTHHDVVTIPAQAIQRGPDGFYVYVVKPDATVEKRAVTTSGISAGIASIATGLAAGDQVVIDGQYKLIPGARVTVRPPPASTPARSVMVGAPA